MSSAIKSTQSASSAKIASPAPSVRSAHPAESPGSDGSMSPLSSHTNFTASDYSPLAPDNDALRLRHDALSRSNGHLGPRSNGSDKLPQLPALHFTRPSYSGSLGLDLQGGFISRFGYGLESMGEERDVSRGQKAASYRRSLPLPGATGASSAGVAISRMQRSNKTSSTRPFAGDWEEYSVEQVDHALSSALTQTNTSEGSEFDKIDIAKARATRRESGKMPQRTSVQGIFDIPGLDASRRSSQGQSRVSSAFSAREVSGLIPCDDSKSLDHRPSRESLIYALSVICSRSLRLPLLSVSVVDIAKMDRANRNLHLLVENIGATPSTMADEYSQNQSPLSSSVSSTDITNESPTPMRRTASSLGRNNAPPTLSSPMRISPLRLAINNSHSVRSKPATSPAGKVFAGRGSVSSTSKKANKAKAASIASQNMTLDIKNWPGIHTTQSKSIGGLSRISPPANDEGEEMLSDCGGSDAGGEMDVARLHHLALPGAQVSSESAQWAPDSALTTSQRSDKKSSTQSNQSSDADAPRTSFDFAGELAALNQEGGSRESFLEQVEAYGLSYRSDELAGDTSGDLSDSGPFLRRAESPLLVEQARKFQPKSLNYNFNQNFRFGSLPSGERAAPVANAAAKISGRDETDAADISFASMSSLGREINSALRRDHINHLNGDGHSTGFGPLPTHVQKPSAFSSFGNSNGNGLVSSTPIGGNGWSAGHRYQESSGDSRSAALSLGRSAVDSEKMFNTKPDQGRLASIEASPAKGQKDNSIREDAGARGETAEDPCFVGEGESSFNGACLQQGLTLERQILTPMSCCRIFLPRPTETSQSF